MNKRMRTISDTTQRLPAVSTTDRNRQRVIVGDAIEYGSGKRSGTVNAIELRCHTIVRQTAELEGGRIERESVRTDVEQRSDAWLLIENGEGRERWMRWSRVCRPGSWREDTWIHFEKTFKDWSVDKRIAHATRMNQLHTDLGVENFEGKRREQ